MLERKEWQQAGTNFGMHEENLGRTLFEDSGQDIMGRFKSLSTLWGVLAGRFKTLKLTFYFFREETKSVETNRALSFAFFLTPLPNIH